MRERSHEVNLQSTLLDSLSDGVAIADHEGKLVYFNRAAERLLGVGVTPTKPEQWSEVYGTRLRDGSRYLAAQEQPLARALAGERPQNVPVLVRNQALPAEIVLSVSACRLPDEALGTAAAAIAIFRDITHFFHELDELKAKVAQLARAALQNTELTGLIAHDLKSPLAGLLAGAQFLVEETKYRKTDRECLLDILNAGSSMHRILADFEDINAHEAGTLALKRAWLDLPAFIRNICDSMAPRARDHEQRIELTLGTQISRINADPILLRRSIEDLIDCSIKCCPVGGVVRVDVENRAARALCIRVSDDGPQVADRFKQRIFDKNAPLELHDVPRVRNGRGLALSFCRIAAEAHGGRIWVEDGESGGCSFCIELPVLVQH